MDTEGCLLGRCAEVSLACAELAPARQFFESAGFLAVTEEDTAPLRLQTPGITLGLHERPPAAVATLRFASADAGAVIEARVVVAHWTAASFFLTMLIGTGCWQQFAQPMRSVSGLHTVTPHRWFVGCTSMDSRLKP